MSAYTKPEPLVELYFHNFVDDDPQGVVKNQGKVVNRISEGFYLVMLFSWATGSPNGLFIRTIEEMRTWRFYSDEETMLFHWEHDLRHRRGTD